MENYLNSPIFVIDLNYVKYCRLLRKMHILHCLNGCRYLLFSGSVMLFNSNISFLMFYLEDLSIYEARVIKITYHSYV